MKKLSFALLSLALCMGLSSCNDDKDDSQTVSYIFELSASEYTSQGYWVDVYNTGQGNFNIYPNLVMSHSAAADEYDGVVYKSWKGFCPSESRDNADHSNDNWVDYQWGSITGGGVGDNSYVIACWDVNETTTQVPERVSVGMGSVYGNEFYPSQVYITNTAWGYYAMKNGSAFSKAFGPHDWCTVEIYGVDLKNNITGQVSVDLARDGKICDAWQLVDLTPLKKCAVIYFQMKSSDTGQWGMNNPAYFALDNFVAVYK